LEPTRDIVSFFAFVSFFPQLVAGPIERATNLLPQFYAKRKFDNSKASDGLRQILWGLFKKIVIADNCAIIVNDIFANYGEMSGSVLLIGSVFFAFQIYGDFSGYSDIAIGTARLFGFDLMKNFAFPYFSRDIGEFWRRWHISLSTWFRDYVYIPLGGSKGSLANKVRNTFIIFVVSGFWHGANWTFIIWGALNAIYFLPLLLRGKNRKNLDTVATNRILPGVKEFLQIGLTFGLTTLAWIFFRSETVTDAVMYISGIAKPDLFSMPDISLKPFAFIALLVLIEWLQRQHEHGLYFSTDTVVKRPIRWLVYTSIIIIIMMFGGTAQEFIYFQF
jgi:alginate O-acetyltransferase complex protein AlgI